MAPFLDDLSISKNVISYSYVELAVGRFISYSIIISLLYHKVSDNLDV